MKSPILTRSLRTASTMAVMLGAVCISASAQPTTTPRGNGIGARNGQMPPVVQRGLGFIEQVRSSSLELKLSDQQQTRIDAIFQTARQDLREMTPDLLQVQPPMRRQQVVALLNGIPEKVKPILTAEQFPLFEQKFTQARQNFAAMPAPVNQPAAPATKPSAPPQLGVLLERLNDYVNQLDLTEEQKPAINKLFANTRQELIDLRSGAEPATPAMQQKAQQIVQSMRQQLGTLLTQSQAEHLRDLVNRGGLSTEPPAMATDTMMGGMGAATPPANAAAQPAAARATVDIPLIEIGQNAPDFTLKRLDGAPLQLSSLKGRYVLLVFGSYSSPSFRQRAAALEQIKASYGTKLNPFIIYTRENYPAGQWNIDRNKDDGISIEQPTSLEARQNVARKVRESLKLSLPTLMDEMDDSTAKAYGGFTNAAVLIDRSGKVVARQKWFEPYALRRLIDEAMK